MAGDVVPVWIKTIEKALVELPKDSAERYNYNERLQHYRKGVPL